MPDYRLRVEAEHEAIESALSALPDRPYQLSPSLTLRVSVVILLV